jgi:hypothetical protein
VAGEDEFPGAGAGCLEQVSEEQEEKVVACESLSWWDKGSDLVEYRHCEIPILGDHQRSQLGPHLDFVLRDAARVDAGEREGDVLAEPDVLAQRPYVGKRVRTGELRQPKRDSIVEVDRPALQDVEGPGKATEIIHHRFDRKRPIDNRPFEQLRKFDVVGPRAVGEARRVAGAAGLIPDRR